MVPIDGIYHQKNVVAVCGRVRVLVSGHSGIGVTMITYSLTSLTWPTFLYVIFSFLELAF